MDKWPSHLKTVTWDYSDCFIFFQTFKNNNIEFNIISYFVKKSPNFRCVKEIKGYHGLNLTLEKPIPQKFFKQIEKTKTSKKDHNLTTPSATMLFIFFQVIDNITGVNIFVSAKVSKKDSRIVILYETNIFNKEEKQ